MSQSLAVVYSGITPCLIVPDAARAIEFYQEVFGAREIVRASRPNGRIAHAELRVGNARLMLADELPEKGMHSPQLLGGSPVMLLVYVDDVDETVRRASAAGAVIIRSPANLSFGDRTAAMSDPFGHRWTVATHKQDVPLDEILRRASGE